MCLKGQLHNITQYAGLRLDLASVERGIQPVDTLLAWRCWKIDKLFPSISLRSESQTAIWYPGIPMSGAPLTKTGVEGVYAYKTIKEMVAGGYVTVPQTDFKQESKVVGQVLLWGKVAEYDNGYRAEYGYPFLLYINGIELQNRLAAVYKCQVSRNFIPRLLAEAA